MDTRHKPIPDAGGPDKGGDNGWTKSAIPRGEDDCCPNSVIRVAFSQKRGEKAAKPQSTHRRQNCQNVAIHDALGVPTFGYLINLHLAPTFPESSLTQIDPETNRREQHDCPTTKACVLHSIGRLRFLLCVSQLEDSGMMKQFHRGALSPAPFGACYLSAHAFHDITFLTL